jgi:hypothetical protein
MSVSPVPPGTPGIERPTPEKKVRDAVRPATPQPAKNPKVEIASQANNLVPPLFPPEHEVTLRGDTPEDHILVYRVLDKRSGALVLQVPSAEVLNDVHRTQEFLQQIAARGKALATDAAASAPVVKKEDKNGSKL